MGHIFAVYVYFMPVYTRIYPYTTRIWLVYGEYIIHVRHKQVPYTFCFSRELLFVLGAITSGQCEYTLRLPEDFAVLCHGRAASCKWASLPLTHPLQRVLRRTAHRALGRALRLEAKDVRGLLQAGRHLAETRAEVLPRDGVGLKLPRCQDHDGRVHLVQSDASQPRHARFEKVEYTQNVPADGEFPL